MENCLLRQWARDIRLRVLTLSYLLHMIKGRGDRKTLSPIKR